MAPPSKSNPSKHDGKNSSNYTPSLNLWVGDLHPETTDHDVISVFKDFGALDALISYYPRIFAFVMFSSIEDSKKAMEALQGSSIKGRKIKIQFGRPTIPGKHIWIGGISKSVSEEQLKHELLQFGKIEELKFVRDRNSAIVGYSNLDDAIAAQKNINGKSIDGQKVRVDFRKSTNRRPESSSQLHGGLDGPLCNTLWVRYPPSVHMDKDMLHNAMILFGEIEAIRTIPTKNYCFVVFRSVDEARQAKEGLDGRLFGDPRIHIKFATSSVTHSRDNAPILPGYREPRPAIFMNGPPLGSDESFGRIHSQLFRPGSGSLSGSHSRHESESNSILGAHPHAWTVSSVWNDRNDATISKRPRFNESPPNNVLFCESDPSPIICGPGRISRTDIWHGVLSKGGSPVCYARCVAVGNGLESPLPEIVDCFARTDLDKLKRQYNEASGFDSVFFYPASEKDFGPYTEFLRYLSDNNRVGVAKCADETHLFLVPPSDFLTKILKITGPERLYGVVFKSLHQPIQEVRKPRFIKQGEDRDFLEVQQSTYIEQREDSNIQEMQQTQYIERREHNCLEVQQRRYIEQREDHNFRRSNELIHMNENVETTSENFSSIHSNSISVASAPRPSNSEVPLTSDVLSILTSLLPFNAQVSAALNSNAPLASSVSSSTFNAKGTQDHQPRYVASQIDPTFNSTLIQPQHSGSRSNIQSSFVSHYPTYDNSTQSQNLASSVPQFSPDSTGHFSNYAPPPEQTFPSNLHYQQQETYYDPYNASSFDDRSSSNTPQNQIGSTADYSDRMQSGLVVINSSSDVQSGQGMSNIDFGASSRQVAVNSDYHDDDEKSKKYQQTLNLAATLLQQLRQQQ